MRHITADQITNSKVLRWRSGAGIEQSHRQHTDEVIWCVGGGDGAIGDHVMGPGQVLPRVSILA